MSEKRLYQHAIISYASEEELKPLLNAAKHYAYIKHDKDYKTNEKGERVRRDTHYHIICTWNHAKSFEAVRKYVVSNQNTIVEELKDKTCKGLIEYYTHDKETDPNKSIYDINDIIMDDIDYWDNKIKGKEEKNTNEEFVNDLLDDAYNPIDMAYKYGRDYIKNYKKYAEFRCRAMEDEWIDTPNRIRYVRGYDPIDALIEHVDPIINIIAEETGISIQTVRNLLDSDYTMKYIKEKGTKKNLKK